MTSFAHLHVHSHYSLLDGLGKVEEYVQRAKELGMKAVALTDKGNTYGLIDLYKACKKADIKPILGSELYIAVRSRFDKEAGIDNRRYQIILLCKNKTGYENLLKLSSEAFCTGMYYKPRIDMELLRQHSEGLIAILPRVNGEIARYILADDMNGAEKALHQYQDIFGENLYIEMLHRPQYEEDTKLKTALQKIAQKNKVPLVATNDVYYVDEDDADIHDTLLCMQFNQVKNDPHRFHVRDYNLSFAAEAQMQEWFADLPEAIENTKKIVDQCQVEFEFGVNRIPKFPIPEEHTDEATYLRFLCEEGVQERYGFTVKSKNTKDQAEIIKRLNYELGVIGKMGFDGYFLIVWDFMKWSRDHGIAVGPGRGSAAGSIVAYLLKITNLDPLKYTLLFERFLNPERISMPDIDLDFADDRREEVLEYVRQKYGSDHVAQICTFGTMAARAAVKDVGRAMALPFSEMNEFAKLIPERPGTTLAQAEKESPELVQKLKNDDQAQQIYKNAKKLEGNVRHISVHACGVIIAPEPILKWSAVQPAPKDEHAIISQYSAKPLESLGLLKMDFLGLRNLTILERAKEILFRTRGLELDIENLPMEDTETFELLSQALTTGVFQMESAGMRRYLKDLKPSQFEDIIAMVSLYRPGPMQFIPQYIDGKHGKKIVTYPHESLEEILKPTFGIAIYQEQILQMAQVFAGFSLGEADILRRAIGKKIASELASQRQKFIDGAKAKGHPEQLAVHIFDDVIEPFAGYGFNKSHAACYALIAYQTAYIKAHYPTEFFAAILSCDKENTDRVILDIEEARQFDIEVLPPNINRSFSDFTVTGKKEIRFGLTAVKGIGQSVVDEIVKIREQEHFATFADFLARMSSKVLNKKSLEALAKSGALSEFLDARIILENMEGILQFVRQEQTVQNEDQGCLFATDTIQKSELKLPDTKPAKLSERLRWEKEVLGIFVSSHPLQGMKPYFEHKGTPILAVPETMRFHKKAVTLNGLCTGIRKLITKKNDVMAIVTIEDLSGKIECVLFPKTYIGFQPFLQEDSFMTIEGKADKRNGEWQIVVDSLIGRDLEKVREEAKKENLIQTEEKKEISNEEETIEEIEDDEDSVGAQFIRSEEEAIDNEEEIFHDGLRTTNEEHEAKVSENTEKLYEHSTSQTPDFNDPYIIDLPNTFTREHMKELHAILSTYKGKQKVQIHCHGHVLTFPETVEISAECQKKIDVLVAPQKHL